QDAGLDLVIGHHDAGGIAGNAGEAFQLQHGIQRLPGLLASGRLFRGSVTERHRADVDGVPEAVVVADMKLVTLRRVAGHFENDLADEAAAVVALLGGAVEVGGLLSQRHWPLFDAGDAAVGVEPGAALVVSPDGADLVARQPAAAPEVTEVAVAEPPGALRRAAPDVAVGRQVE